MKSKITLSLVAFSLVLSNFMLAAAAPDQEQTQTPRAKVIVRFAGIRALPAVNAKIIKQIGYGTMLLVLGKTGDYFQVAPIQAAQASVVPVWYIHQGEIELVSTKTFAGLQESRQVKFEPQRPVAGQPVLFTALNFHTPNLLKWDMGDGIVLTSGSKSSQVADARLAYAYAAAGTYEVKVYDDKGDLSLPPLTFKVTVAAYPRLLQVNPERPVANRPLTISALNFDTPQNITWDLGDGTEIKPGNESGFVKPCFMITHIYAAAGIYTVKAWDVNGNKSLPPVVLSVQVGADTGLIRIEPVKRKVLADNAAPVQNALVPLTVKPDNLEVAESTPPRPKKNLAIKIGPYAGFFQPRDANLKSIYGDGDVIYGGRLGIHVWQGVYVWLSASRFQVIAKTTFSEEKTTLTLTPLSAFLRGGLSLGFFCPYVGIGYTHMTFKEESEIGNVKGDGGNTSYEAGFELKMNRHFIMDLGVRYDLIKVNLTGFDVDLGGLQAGISLLVSF
ncbi:MAG: PKD domain-containing protein [Candidatus Aminicenantes bacterium]|nr:PKD domain-containing protein [Candidatus Aminicenantes bacterium]